MTAVTLCLASSTIAAQAQGYYRERDDGIYRDRDLDGDRGRGRARGFNERAYLRCNPDVRRSVNRGETDSGYAHYRIYGRREGRQLTC